MDLFAWLARLLGALLGALLLAVIIAGSVGFGAIILLLGLLAVAFGGGRMRGAWRVSGATGDAARKTFFESAFTLMGRVAKCDGRISEQEIQVTEQLMVRMGLTPEHRQQAIGLFKQGAEPAFDVESQLARFMQHCGAHANLRHMLLMFLFSTAAADGALSGPEHALLQQVAARLGFSAAAFEQLLRMFNAQDGFAEPPGAVPRAHALADAYAALGIRENVSDREAKQAYRRLMSQYHPDKLIAEGMPADMVKMATERTQEIQNAWELIRKARGI
jgi:DnaJ like chaperone protein